MDASLPRYALVAGATGLVGRHILQGLLADDSVAQVHALGRRLPGFSHPRLSAQAVDFAALPILPAVSEVYLALGTTIQVAGSQAAFRAVDHDANLAVARAARAAGATRCALVSAMGADARSRIFYSRVKGELEEALAALGFSTLVIAQPSFLAGDRVALGQPERPGEKLALSASRWLAPLIPDRYKSIPASAVARALLDAVPRLHGRHVLPSSQMRG